MDDIQNNFLLSPPAQALKPSEALRLKLDEAYDRFKLIRWGWSDGRPLCPKCQHERVYERGDRIGFRCAKCGSDFTVTSRTAFSSRKLSYQNLLGAISLRLHHRASPAVMMRELGIDYKTAWSTGNKFVLFGNTVVRTRERLWPFSDGQRKADGSALVANVNAAIPRELPEQVRADVAQDMILGVLTGEITESQLKSSVKKYITKYYRGYDNRFACLSFDQDVPGTDGMRWDEILADDPNRYDYAFVR